MTGGIGFGLQSANGKDPDHGDLRCTRHSKAQENPERQGEHEDVRENGQGRLDDMEAVVDALGVGVIPQLWVPVRLDRHALEQRAEEYGDRVHDSYSNQHPYYSEDGVVVPADAEEEDQNRQLDECQDRVVAQLLEKVPPQTRSRVMVGNIFVTPAEIAELENCFAQRWISPWTDTRERVREPAKQTADLHMNKLDDTRIAAIYASDIVSNLLGQKKNDPDGPQEAELGQSRSSGLAYQCSYT